MIKENRIKKNYTQEKLAELINISPRQLQRIEKNENKTKIETLKRLIDALQIPDEEIVTYLKKLKKLSGFFHIAFLAIFYFL